MTFIKKLASHTFSQCEINISPATFIFHRCLFFSVSTKHFSFVLILFFFPQFIKNFKWNSSKIVFRIKLALSILKLLINIEVVSHGNMTTHQMNPLLRYITVFLKMIENKFVKIVNRWLLNNLRVLVHNFVVFHW